MKSKLTFIFIITLFIHCSWANVISFSEKNRKENISYGIFVDDPVAKAQALELIQPALNLAFIAGAKINPDVHFKATPDNYNLLIHVTTKEDAIKDETQYRQLKALHAGTGDGYTLQVAEDSNGTVIVRILWDQVMLEKVDETAFKERRNAFAKLIVVLTHEIFGNALNFIRNKDRLMSPEFLYSESKRTHFSMQAEVIAFTKGIEVLDKMIEIFANQLSPKLINDLKELLVQERSSLVFHQSRLNQYEQKNTLTKILSFSNSKCSILFN